MSYITKEELSALQELSEKRMDKYLMSFVLEDLKSYRIAQQLRGIARRCQDEAAELIQAAEWLEDEAKDILGLRGSVTHHEIKGRITAGCVTHNAEITGG